MTERSLTIGNEAEDKGIEFVCDKYSIAKESAKRYRRHYRRSLRDMDESIIDNNTVIQKLVEQYTPSELRQLANGKALHRESSKVIHSFNGEKLTIGVMSDTHIGSKYTDDDYVLYAFDEFSKRGVDFVTNSGDVCEGLSNRQGHMYECTEIGYLAQKQRAIELLSQWDCTPQYMISGNHDRWYMKSAGANIVRDICDNIDNAVFLGDDEGNINVGNDTTIRLWHGEDGSSYAHSYRIQKLIESFTGGDKPDCLIAGHVHKMGYFFDRHVHCISAGCIQRQSSWMRSKRLPSHTGFWIIEMTLNESGIGTFKPEFFPFYV